MRLRHVILPKGIVRYRLTEKVAQAKWLTTFDLARYSVFNYEWVSDQKHFIAVAQGRHYWAGEVTISATPERRNPRRAQLCRLRLPR